MSFGNPLSLESVNVDGSESGVLFSDTGFFQVFDFIWIEGSSETALRIPNEIVLTKELAGKYFGNDRARGRSMTSTPTLKYAR